ncbi:MAG: hypothetical protein QUU85_00580 [Candidatus Eisenbacteria bacterium]|nr:hypothetical protein [Candidatus Eisenbacteria bacterium]
MKRLFFAFCALALVATVANADVPDPSNCSTSLDGPQRVLLIPDENGTSPVSQATFTVTVKNAANNPINNAIVEILIGGIADNKTKLCASETTSYTTNVAGQATINLGGGGCYKGPNAIVIRANGVEIRNFNAAVSPDYGGSDNAGLPGLWSLSVTLADFTALSAAFGNPNNPSCHDYNNDGLMTLTDFTVFGQSWLSTTRDCTP